MKIKGFSHINVVVDDLETATKFYKDCFGAQPVLEHIHFKNPGFSKAAGFVDTYNSVDVSIRFIHIADANLTIELMQYHSPEGRKVPEKLQTNDVKGVGHVSLEVEDVNIAFEKLRAQKGMKLITDTSEYRPTCISVPSFDQVTFYDVAVESNEKVKQEQANHIGTICYFYCVDPYGVQWELFQQG